MSEDVSTPPADKEADPTAKAPAALSADAPSGADISGPEVTGPEAFGPEPSGAEAPVKEPSVEDAAGDAPTSPPEPAKTATSAGPGIASVCLAPVRVLLDVVVFLAILLAAGCAVLYYVCTYEPRLITSHIEDYLVELTDMPWQLNGGVKPVFSPYPGLRVADVRALAATVEQEGAAKSDKPLLEVRELSLLLDPASLESFTPRIHLIELDSPVINLAYDEKQRPLWLPPEAEQAASAPGLPHAAKTTAKPGSGQSASVKPGKAGPAAESAAGQSAQAAQAAQTTGEAPQADEDPLKTMADTVCLLPNTIGIPVKIRNGSLRSWSADGKLLLSLQGFDGDFDPTAFEENLHLNSSFSLPGADLSLTFSIAATVGYEDIPARGHMTGKLQMRPPGSRMISGTFDTPFTWMSDGRHVALPEFVLRSEGDALSADLLADLAGPSCTGKVTLNKVSLTRWFQFGRSLPPGLREALHNLVGDFDLVLDSKRAEAKNLRGRAGKIAVRGYVGTPDFAKPVVVVDLDIGQANVDPLFPFLAAIGRTVPDPTPPRFDHPPLVPYPADPKAPPSPSSVKVGYDVHIDVARPTVHDVTGGPLVVTVAPAVVKGVAKTRVGIAAKSIIKGSLTGYIDIDDDSMAMHFEPKDLELGLLPENAMNAVKIAGRVTGQCDIDIPFKKNGDLADDWGIRVDAAIKGCEITGKYGKKNWKLHFGTARANGRGSIHAVQPDGVRIEGAWDIAGSAINTSWYPGGKDAINGKFTGGLYWLPIHGKKGEKRGVNKIAGSLVADGSLVIPVGKLRPPLKGKLNTNLEWMLYGEKLALRKTSFEGFKSIVKGDVDINYSGKDVLVTSQPSFTLSPYDFLKGWDLVPSDSFTLPKVVTGRTGVKGTGSSLEFRKIKADVDGRAYSGDIFWKDNPRSGDAGLWTFRMNTVFLDLDKFVAVTPTLPKGKRPPLPSKKAWNLKALQDLAFDVELTAQRGKREKLQFSKAKLTAALQRDRFTVLGEAANFYGGTATVIFQGSVVPQRSLVTLRKGLAEMHSVDLGRLFKDMSGDLAYGGKADLVVDMSGHMSCDADVPAKLSGAWKLGVTDGLYPSFVGGDKSSVRNTFSSASASGAIDKGVLRSRNFRLTGPMVDMSGSGWYSLVSKDYDMEVSVTFAKVPTVPVRIYGSVYDPKMQVRGANMVVETVQQAGSTMFGLVKGVLMLPAYAIQGLGNLAKGGKDDKDAKNPPKRTTVAPHRNQTGHPGQ